MVYLCPSCGENLQVVYDYEQLKKKCSKEFFEKNTENSIWRYLPLLPIKEGYKTLSLKIGWTPLYKVSYPNIPNLYFKEEGKNPSASLKDRASAIALVNAIESQVERMVGASTGNAGSSLACLGANAQIPVTIFIPKNAPKAKIAQLLIFGAKVIMVDGSYDDAYELAIHVSKNYGWYNRNTGYNPYTREGKKTCAFEICEQLHWKVPDWVLVSVGDGNIISGLWKGFCEFYQLGLIDKLPKMAAVQSNLSNAISKATNKIQKNIPYPKLGGYKVDIQSVDAKTIADSISVNLPRDGVAAVKAIIDSGGMAVEVADIEILRAMKEMARKWGIFGEPAAAASFAGLKKLLSKQDIKIDEKVVCVVTGNGLKDVESVIKISKEPQIIQPTIEAVEEIFGLPMG